MAQSSEHRATRSRWIPTILVGLLGAVAFAAGLADNEAQPEATAEFAFDEATLDISELDVLADRSPEVPELPFEDNPDPTQCGIPNPWGGQAQAWLNGVYEGALIQPTVFVYDSHLRLDIAGSAPHGTMVEVLLYQSNPELDYYLVDLPGDQPQGWIPAPLLSFEEIEAGT